MHYQEACYSKYGGVIIWLVILDSHSEGFCVLSLHLLAVACWKRKSRLLITSTIRTSQHSKSSENKIGLKRNLEQREKRSKFSFVHFQLKQNVSQQSIYILLCDLIFRTTCSEGIDTWIWIQSAYADIGFHMATGTGDSTAVNMDLEELVTFIGSRRLPLSSSEILHFVMLYSLHTF